MPGEEYVAFSPEDADRIVGAVRRVESLSDTNFGAQPTEDDSGDLWRGSINLQWLRITSISTTDGRYPSVLQTYDGTQSPGSRWADGDAAWLEIANDFVPDDGALYLARMQDYDNDRFVFVAPEVDASFTSRGGVNLLAQIFKGAKTFYDFVTTYQYYVSDFQLGDGAATFTSAGAGTFSCGAEMSVTGPDGAHTTTGAIILRAPKRGGGDASWSANTFCTITGVENGGASATDPQPSWAVTENGPGGTTYLGAWATINGLVVKGGLIISGSISGLTVPQGGTGASTFTAHGVLLGEGTSAIAATAAMTNGQLLVGQTGADPLPKTISGDGTINASGVLTVTTIGGVAPGTGTVTNGSNLTDHAPVIGDGGTVGIKTTAAMTNGQVLVGATGADPVPKTISGDFTLAASGAATIANDAVTYGKMQNTSAASVLLGRGSAAGAGDVQEITLDPLSGLVMRGTAIGFVGSSTYAGVSMVTATISAGTLTQHAVTGNIASITRTSGTVLKVTFTSAYATANDYAVAVMSSGVQYNVTTNNTTDFSITIAGIGTEPSWVSVTVVS